MVKVVLLAIIAILGCFGALMGISPVVLLRFYAIIAIIPIIIIVLRKDLSNGVFLWMFSILFTNVIGKIDLPVLPDISSDRVVLLLLSFVFLIQIAFSEKRMLPLTVIEILMIIFCCICLFSMIKAGSIVKKEGGLALSNFLNGYAMPFAAFFFAKNILDNESRIKRLFLFLFLLGTYLTFTGIFEHYHFTALVFPREIMDRSFGIHFGRARGPFGNAAVNGTVLAMIFITSIYFLMSCERKLSKILGFIVFLTPITIFFTHTRAVWLGFFVSILIVVFFYPKVRKLFLALFFSLVIITALNWANVTSKDRSVGGVADMDPVYDRINLYGATLNMFVAKPFFGFGFDTFQDVSPRYFRKIQGIPYKGVGLPPHDTLAGILVELGLAGFIPLVLIFFGIFRNSFCLYRRLSSNAFVGKWLVVIFWAASAVFLVNIEFIEMRYFQFANSLFFLLAGLIVGINQRFSGGDNNLINQPGRRTACA